jgi:hypothetical protein
MPWQLWSWMHTVLQLRPMQVLSPRFQTQLLSCLLFRKALHLCACWTCITSLLQRRAAAACQILEVLAVFMCQHCVSKVQMECQLQYEHWPMSNLESGLQEEGRSHAYRPGEESGYS